MTSTPGYKQFCSSPDNKSCSTDAAWNCKNKLTGTFCNNCNRDYIICQGAGRGLWCPETESYHPAPCRVDGSFTWPSSNQSACCSGDLNDPHNCDPCWCPFSGSCLPYMGEYCKKSKEGVPFLFSDERCRQWCREFPELCKPVQAEVCVGTNLENALCTEYCKQKDVDCDDRLNAYCQSLDPQIAQKKDLCGCFMPSAFYENFFNSLQQQGYKISATPDLPECYYPYCAASQVQNYRQRHYPQGCPPVKQCVINNVIGNDGTIAGDINITANEQCDLSKSAPAPGPTPGPGPNPGPSPGPKPSPVPPPGPVPSPSSTNFWKLHQNALIIGGSIVLALFLFLILRKKSN